MRRQFANLRFSPRPRGHKYVRKLFWTGSLDYISSGPAGRLETRIGTGGFDVELQNGDKFTSAYNDQRDTLTRGFPDLANRAFIVKVNRLFRF